MRIDTLLSDISQRGGGKPAIIAGRVRYSYADFDLHVSRLAGALAQRRVGPGERVALFMDPGYAAVVTLFAVARVGATLLPLDARSTAETLRREFGRIDVAAMVTEARLAGATADAIAGMRTLRVVVLSGADRATCSENCLSFEAAVSGLGPAAPLPVAAADLPAVLLAGHPDSEPLSHRDLAAMGAAEDTREDALVPVPPVSSRAGLAAIVGAVAAGATLVAESATVIPGVRPRDREAEAFRLALAS